MEKPSKAKEERALTEDQKAFLERRKRLRKERRLGGESEYEERGVAAVDLFSGKPLGIFEPGCAQRATEEEEEDTVPLSTWRRCHERHIGVKSTPRPRHMLDEMAQMTDRGIMWHFPIDNEQGADQEQVNNETCLYAICNQNILAPS